MSNVSVEDLISYVKELIKESHNRQLCTARIM